MSKDTTRQWCAERGPFYLDPLKESYDGMFAAWATDFLARGDYKTSTLPPADVVARIEDLVRLSRLLPPAEQWKRGADKLLLNSEKRYRRGRTRASDHVPRGEHAIEQAILDSDPSTTPATSLGLPLIDGINAVPLAKDHSGGRRSGNVEADMLLLVGRGSKQQLHLVEVKDRSNNAWFAVVESLRQLLLFRNSNAAQRIMIDRGHAASELRLTGLVLAPKPFYTGNESKRQSKKRNAVEPAQQLIRSAEERLGLRCVLAVWDEAAWRSGTRDIARRDA